LITVGRRLNAKGFGVRTRQTCEVLGAGGFAMTEFELINLFNAFFDDTFSRLADFMTGTFAMLISTYFAGAKLSRNLARLVVFLYSLFAMATAVPTLAAAFRFTQVAQLMKGRMSEPGSLIDQIFPSLPSPYLVMPVMIMILVGAYVGTLAFFYQARKGKVPQATGFN
jgi:hypothetical protein